MKRGIFIPSGLLLFVSAVVAADYIADGIITTKTTKDAQVIGAAASEFSSNGTLSLTGFDNVTITGNTTQNTYASAHSTKDENLAAGGALYADSLVSITANTGNITFSNNTLSAKTTNDARTRVRAGAIYADSVSISNNTGSSISFSGNKALDQYKAWDNTVGAQVDKPRYSSGGAIYADRDLTISNNPDTDIVFSNNEAGKGGAIAASYGATMTITGNGQVSFTDNVAEYGGAAYTGVYLYINSSNTAGNGTLNITNNKGVSFSGNKARNNGGAIYNQTNGTVNISNNTGDVSFDSNTAVLFGGAIVVRVPAPSP